MKRLTALLVALALIAGMVGCPAEPGPDPDPLVRYELTIASTEGGQVTTPGEGAATYEAGAVVEIIAEADAGYRFGSWTGDVDTIAGVDAASTAVRIEANYTITANFIAQYELIISSTEGGRVTAPGEGVFAYDVGTVVDLIGEAEDGYQFMGWAGDIGAIADADACSTTVTVTGNYAFTAGFAKEVRDWYDLHAIRDNLSGSYILINHLDSTTDGYTELASSTADQGRGWEPIGTVAGRFSGAFDGQGHEIRGLVVSRHDDVGVGLFGVVHVGGVVRNLGLVNADVTGDLYVGGLVGANLGTVSRSYYSGTVRGDWRVGGLAGINFGTVSGSHASGSVSGRDHVGGLVGHNSYGALTNSHYCGSVSGAWRVGGLVGANEEGTISNSHYDYDDVLINAHNVITKGALYPQDFEEWLANDGFLDVDERLSQENGYYLINNVDDFKQLLAFGQDESLRFKLKNDLDLDNEPDFYIPYLAGEFDGNGHRILNLNLSFNVDGITQVGLFGFLAFGGEVTQVGVENANITKAGYVGSLVGWNVGTVSNSYSTGSVSGEVVGGLVGGQGSTGTVSNSHSTASVKGGWAIGGLVGTIHGGGSVSNSYSTGSVTGVEVGGLVGHIRWGTVSNSYYNYDEVLINGDNVITVGALFSEDFEQWLANDKSLDVNERLSQEDGYYLINDVDDFRQLLVFGQDSSLKFRLESDLDLATEANFYVPYLAGEFRGNGHKVLNLSLDLGSVAHVGLFGLVGPGGEVSEVGVENASITGFRIVGGLAGGNWGGSVGNSYFAGSVTGKATGETYVGGLVALNWVTGTVSNSYSKANVKGDVWVGGLVGMNWGSTVSTCYSVGEVSGARNVGGLAGANYGTVSNSFWDVETSGMDESAGGMGKTTEEMKDIATFSGAGWRIVGVASPGVRNTPYVWNIVDGQTYPFLSWQPVS